MTDTTFEAVTDDGARLKAWSSGSGERTLLLVSGLGGSGGFWKAASDRLAERYRVLRFDQRGIASSERGSAEVTIDRLARDCLAVLDAAGTQRCVLLGHSTGGCIGQAFATIAPGRLESLVLSATWLRPSRYMSALFGTRQEILGAMPAAYAASAALLSYPPEWLEANWHVYESSLAKAPATPEAVKIVNERIDALLSFDGSANVADLTMPCLVLGAADDMIVPNFLQRELAAALPCARIETLADGGHFYPLTRTDAFVKAVTEWDGGQ